MPTETINAPALLVGDEEAWEALPAAWRGRDTPVPVFEFAQADRALGYQHLIVSGSVTHLERVASTVSAANRQHHLAAFLLNTDAVAPEWVTQVLDESDFRALRRLLVHRGNDVPLRVLQAWSLDAPGDFIADATVVADTLWVRDCRLERHKISFDAYPALRRIRPEDRAEFAIEEDGYLLVWPEAQVHLDLEAIRRATDTGYRRACTLAALQEQQDLGEAIREFRKAHRLTQHAIPGLSARHLRRIEAGEVRLGETALDDLAAAHGMNPDDYLNAVTELLGRGPFAASHAAKA